MDESLRDLLDLAVGEPPRLMSLNSIRRRAVQRRITQAGVTGITVLAVGLGVTLSAYAVRGGQPATGGVKVPAGPPRYYVVQNYSQGKTTVVVRARSTGKVTSGVRDPLPGVDCSGDLAAAGAHTFFISCPIWRKKPGSEKSTIEKTKIYRFEVNGSGQATTPTPLKGGTLMGFLGEGLTSSPDGSQVAIQVFRPSPDGNIYTNSVATGIFVINTKTGKRVIWRTGPYIPGKIGYTQADDISFTRNGSELVLLGSLCPRTRYLDNCQPSDAREVRAFGPADRGGSLQGGQVLLRRPAFTKSRTSLSDALITPDGTALTTVTVNCPRGSGCTLTVEKIGITTGKVLKVLYQVRYSANPDGAGLVLFGADPTGRFLILVANTATSTKQPVNGWIDHGRLMPLTPARGFAVNTEVW